MSPPPEFYGENEMFTYHAPRGSNTYDVKSEDYRINTLNMMNNSKKNIMGNNHILSFANDYSETASNTNNGGSLNNSCNIDLKPLDGANLGDSGTTGRRCTSDGSQRFKQEGCDLQRNCIKKDAESLVTFGQSSIPNANKNRIKYSSFLRNRYLLLVMYCIYCIICGPALFNWSPLRQMLYWNEDYKWLCDADEINSASNAYIDKATGTCNLSRVEISKLYSIYVACNFIFCMVAGFLADTIGSKLSCFIGITLQAAGWTLLSFGSQVFQGYKGAMALIGMGIDTAFLPLLSLANLFPGNESTIIAILGASRSMSFVVTLAMKVVMRETKFQMMTITLSFVIIFLGICFLIVLLFVPIQPFVKQNLTDIDNNNGNTGTNEKNNHVIFVEKIKDFSRYFLSAKYLLIIPIIMITLLRCVFYGTASEDLLPDALAAFEIISIFSFAPCPLMGYIADRWGILTVMQIVNGFALLMILCVTLPSNVVLQYISSFSFALAASFLMSQFYCYISENFPLRHQGKLIGFLTTVGGVMSLTCSSMFAFSLDHGFMIMLLILLGLSLLVVILLEFARYSLKRK